MKKLFFLTLVSILFLKTGNAQSSINDYKYVIVEKQFHFQNEADEYDLNRLVKYQFRKYNFRPIIQGEALPDDLKSNYCLALNSEVKASGAFRTKVVITLTNCNNEVIYTSAEGITKEKDLDRAFDLAIRKVFDTFSSINYKYVANDKVISEGKSTATTEESSEELEKLKAEIESLKEEKNRVEEAKETVDAIDDSGIKKLGTSSTNEKKIQEKAESIKGNEENSIESDPRLFFAQKTTNGFQLLYNSEVVMTAIKTAMTDVYLVQGKEAILYKENGIWKYFESTAQGAVNKKMNIKILP